jgi:hypothetical protein
LGEVETLAQPTDKNINAKIIKEVKSLFFIIPPNIPYNF